MSKSLADIKVASISTFPKATVRDRRQPARANSALAEGGDPQPSMVKCPIENILLISTVNHNPGDEFIRLGQEYLLRKLLPGAKFSVVHKHDPRTLFDGFIGRTTRVHSRLMPLVYSAYARSRGSRQQNLLESADLVVFAGTPFIWRSGVWPFPSTSANAEWIGATWKRLFTELLEKPVMNIAAGASFANQSQIEMMLRDAHVVGFLKQAVRRSALTTARDNVTGKVLGQLGFDIPVLPCTSIFAAKSAGIAPAEPEYVAVNLMPGAVHSYRRQRGDTTTWRTTISAVIPEIEKRHPVVFVSHSRDEDETAAQWFPGRRRILSTNPIELLRTYSRARFGVCNRVHAAAAVAAFGRPVIVVGGDSRVNLVEQFGMPAMDHRETDATTLNDAVANLEHNYASLSEELRARTIGAEAAYNRLISSALGLSIPE